MKLISALALVLACIVLPAAAQQSAAAPRAASRSLADSMQRKLDYMEANGRKAHPDPKPTVISEAEANAYVAAGRVKLPAGVQAVTFSGTPGVITGNARVDFDQLTASQRSSNPLLGAFTGVHDVVVASHASGAAGTGHVVVDTVSLDGVEIPRFVLDMFVKHYLQRYPGVGMDSTFRMPSRVSTATVGNHSLTLVQK
jgi:hypothetical protein